MSAPHLTILTCALKELADELRVKRSTLYAWVAAGRIPAVRMHRLIRFRRDEIEEWVRSFQKPNTQGGPVAFGKKNTEAIDKLIARAKRDLYTAGHGETRPESSSIRKEDVDGAV
jgi:excisionase family DNA binding protein